jgi:hypothetical protein
METSRGMASSLDRRDKGLDLQNYSRETGREQRRGRHHSLGISRKWRIQGQNSLPNYGGLDLPPIKTIWNKIWSKSLWPKISTFLWLVANRRILTWDRLLRKWFVGPSRCSLCYDSEETQDHILSKCNFTMQLWDQGATNFQRTDLQKDNVVATIELWRDNPFNNVLINRAWEIFPGILMWNVWKERNRRIFKDKSLPKINMWELINRNMTESIAVTQWMEQDLQVQAPETTIFNNWNLGPCLNKNPQVKKTGKY